MAKKVHAAGVVFENLVSEVLILQRHEQSVEGGKWGLPGGKSEPGETAVEAALREAWEETGYRLVPEQLKPVGTYRWTLDEFDVTFEVFQAMMADKMMIKLDPAEHTDYSWGRPLELLKRRDLQHGLYIVFKDLYETQPV